MYLAAGDGSLSSVPEMVITRYRYTLPSFRSLENAKKKKKNYWLYKYKVGADR
jgi:hypothetical protein